MESNQIGVGKVNKISGRFFYEGTFPDNLKHHDELVVLRRRHFEESMRKGLVNLLATRFSMDKLFYEKTEHNYSLFPDMIISPEKQNLILDRNFYAYDPNLCIWIRYETADALIDEEGFLRAKKK